MSLAIYVSARDQDSGPRVCVASALLTEPSPPALAIFFFPETESPVAQADLELAMELRMTLNSWSSCLSVSRCWNSCVQFVQC